eukprot:gb/GECG01012925.1/.p1 GENE.gb/GECG01012925.1/~~gb/GECG01012925.1/.p1  ORF type:complete len:1879 (+),score=252.19 gb/GECG01012925.1/:1-5637(+)
MDRDVTNGEHLESKAGTGSTSRGTRASPQTYSSAMNNEKQDSDIPVEQLEDGSSSPHSHRGSPLREEHEETDSAAFSSPRPFLENQTASPGYDPGTVSKDRDTDDSNDVNTRQWMKNTLSSLRQTIRNQFVEPEAPSGPRTLRAHTCDEAFIHNEQQKFASNVVTTSRYTVLNFVFKFLWFQFQRFANVYFLLVTILQTIPSISITEGLPTQALPLSFVLAFDGILTAIEDYRRHQEDAKANGATTLVFRGVHSPSKQEDGKEPGGDHVCRRRRRSRFNIEEETDGKNIEGSHRNLAAVMDRNHQRRKVGFARTAWKDLQVGDIVKIKAGETFPADIVFLSAVNEDPEENAVCFVKTAQLDGESNLKLKKAPHQSVDFFSNLSNIAKFRGWVEASAPDPHFERFSATLYWGNTPEVRNENVSLMENNLLLRGCELHNCEYIYGLVVYTGEETKIRVNAQKQRPSKLSSVDGAINRFIVRQLGLLVVLCVIGAVGHTIWQEENKDSAFYLALNQRSEGDVVIFIQRFFTFFLLNAQLIPISLYVSMKLARQLQKFFIEFDEEMHHVDTTMLEKTNGVQGNYRATDRSMDLNDELGQVTHIFSDKTGTLTVNSFDFRKISINGVAYGLGTTPIGVIRRRRQGEDVSELEALLEKQASSKQNTPHVTFLDGSDDDGTHWEEYLSQTKQSSVDGESKENCGSQEVGFEVPSWLTAARQRERERRTLARSFSKSPTTSLSTGFLYEDLEQIKAVILRYYGKHGEKQLNCPRKEVYMSGHAGDHIAHLLAAEGVNEHVLALHRMLLHLALDHSVEIEVHRDEDGNFVEERYSASSPDEEAFVYMAKTCGYEFKQRKRDIVTLGIFGIEVQYRIIADLAYSQERKMMSTIVLDEISNSYMMFAKGADSKIYSLMSRSLHTVEEQRAAAAAEYHMTEWAEDGLRTMAFAWKPLDSRYAIDWFSRYRVVDSDVNEREKKAKKEANQIDKLISEIERDFIVQGATGIEDRLQEHVGTTIATLADAGVRMYMLTGDKQETAINIGYAVQMLHSQQKKMVLTEDTLGKGIKNAAKAAAKIADLATEFRVAMEQGNISAHPYALVIDDPTISRFLDADQTSVEDRYNLCYVAEHCETVICCRCSPSHKKDIIQLIQRGVQGSRCLAIGDGANDVDMIVSSHVGVGIMGSEGSQAANNADFAVAKFHDIQRLLLVHGRWNYRRMSLLVPYLFYKNVVFTLAQFFHTVFMGWSGEKIYLEFAIQTFNLVYTGLPPMVVGIWDQDIDGDSSQRFPYVYSEGRLGSRLNNWVFFGWMLTAIWEALAIYLCGLKLAFDSELEGQTQYVYVFGSVVLTGVIVVTNLRLVLHATLHHWFFQLSVVASIAIWFPAALVFDDFDDERVEGGIPRLLRSWSFWFVLPLMAALALLPTICYRGFQRLWYPTYRDLVHECQVFVRNHNHKDAYVKETVNKERMDDRIKHILGYTDIPTPKCLAVCTQSVTTDPLEDREVDDQSTEDKKYAIVPLESTPHFQHDLLKQMEAPLYDWNTAEYEIREKPHSLQLNYSIIHMKAHLQHQLKQISDSPESIAKPDISQDGTHSVVAKLLLPHVFRASPPYVRNDAGKRATICSCLGVGDVCRSGSRSGTKTSHREGADKDVVERWYAAAHCNGITAKGLNSQESIQEYVNRIQNQMQQARFTQLVDRGLYKPGVTVIPAGAEAPDTKAQVSLSQSSENQSSRGSQHHSPLLGVTDTDNLPDSPHSVTGGTPLQGLQRCYRDEYFGAVEERSSREDTIEDLEKSVSVAMERLSSHGARPPKGTPGARPRSVDESDVKRRSGSRFASPFLSARSRQRRGVEDTDQLRNLFQDPMLATRSSKDMKMPFEVNSSSDFGSNDI